MKDDKEKSAKLVTKGILISLVSFVVIRGWWIVCTDRNTQGILNIACGVISVIISGLILIYIIATFIYWMNSNYTIKEILNEQWGEN